MPRAHHPADHGAPFVDQALPAGIERRARGARGQRVYQGTNRDSSMRETSQGNSKPGSDRRQSGPPASGLAGSTATRTGRKQCDAPSPHDGVGPPKCRTDHENRSSIRTAGTTPGKRSRTAPATHRAGRAARDIRGWAHRRARSRPSGASSGSFGSGDGTGPSTAIPMAWYRVHVQTLPVMRRRAGWRETPRSGPHPPRRARGCSGAFRLLYSIIR